MRQVKLIATAVLLIACTVWFLTPSRTAGKSGRWLNHRSDELGRLLVEIQHYQQAVKTEEAKPNRFSEAREAYIDDLAQWLEGLREDYNMYAREYNHEMARHQRAFVAGRWRRLPPGARPDLLPEYPLITLHSRWAHW